MASWLDSTGALWCHVPNEGQRHPAVGRRLQAAGLKRGVPDVLVFTPAPIGLRPVAIELKRERGGVVSPQQVGWLAGLHGAGWLTHVARGAHDAIAFLMACGFQPLRAD